ncbi:MAG: peptidoglycan-binding protein [Planctomycetota bacterium]
MRPHLPLCSLGLIACALASPAAAADALDPIRAGQGLLRRGARGAAVGTLQRLLNERARESLVVDGVFGVRTEVAVRSFQGAQRLSVDGVVGPRTVAALDALAGSTPRAPSPTPPRAPAPPPGAGGMRSIPPRPANARGGRQVLASTDGMSLAARGRALTQELLAGNLPAFERRLVPLTLSGAGGDGRQHSLTVWVTPDYLAVGDDGDFVRVPLDPLEAQRVADAFGCLLPTARLVDAAWQQAGARLEPAPLPPSAQMQGNDYLRRAEAAVEARRAGTPLGTLVAGVKKDVVITNRLLSNPRRVAIYGWHRRDGRPWQPLSTVHEDSYADYSHGVRLVSRRVVADGNARDLEQLYRDPTFAPLLSGEGPLRIVRYGTP